MRNSPAGSLWRRWDLHVHTPASIVNHYGESGADPWEQFLDDLERLPPEFAVLGINDYIFLDGYKRVREAKEEGRLANITTLLPVIELRLPIFGGHDKLKRLNYHVIFSDDLDPEIIQAQFLNAITARYDLTPAYKGRVDWMANPTPASLSELGALIKTTVPPERLPEFGSDFEEGFNNLTIPLDVVRSALERPAFRSRHLTALGKTEWDDIRWNDHSIADKKTVVNDVDLLFTAAESPDAWRRGRERLLADNVNAKLLDCSDAHWLSTSRQKDRIGNCFTWLCADPTFVGLKHALSDFAARTFIGDVPGLLSRTTSARTKYMSRVEIRKNPDSLLVEPWFDVDVALNPGFVAVIGNRGQGKSALADTLGLLGSSRNQRDASFLSDDRFRNPRHNKAQEFTARLTWLSGEQSERSLDDDVGAGEPERVKCLPQNLLERICNELPGTEVTRFEHELREVIFSHVSQADRLGESSLDGLLQRLTQATDERIEILRSELRGLNQRIADIEDRLAPERKARLAMELKLKRIEVESHARAEPSPVEKPEQTENLALVALIEDLRRERDTLARALAEHRGNADASADAVARADAIAERIRNLRLHVSQFVEATAADATALGIDVHQLVRLEVNVDSLDHIRAEALARKTAADAELDPGRQDSTAFQLVAQERAIGEAADRLDEPGRLYQVYQRQREEWQSRGTELVGDRDQPGTLAFIEGQLKELDALPLELDELRARRKEKTTQIHAELRGLAERYRQAYAPVHDFVSNHPLATQIGLAFQVTLEEEGFSEALWERLNRAVAGSFSGIDEGERVLNQILRAVDWTNASGVVGALESIDGMLHSDQREGKGQRTALASQLRRGYRATDLYDLLWGLAYLRPHYQLQLSGQPLAELSPGQKGTLLLVFYLLVDKADVPLVIDQPEENLDNETVTKLLVPALKEARARRQLVLVTHNPNIAVVGDADQIIYAKFENAEVSYDSGAMENPTMNRRLTDVLEGTLPAFRNRRDKYVWELSLAEVESL